MKLQIYISVGVFRFFYFLNCEIKGYWWWVSFTMSTWLQMCSAPCKTPVWEVCAVTQNSLIYCILYFPILLKKNFLFNVFLSCPVPCPAPFLMLIWFFFLLLPSYSLFLTHFKDCVPASPFFILPASTLTAPSTGKGLASQSSPLECPPELPSAALGTGLRSSHCRLVTARSSHILTTTAPVIAPVTVDQISVNTPSKPFNNTMR